MNILFKTFLVVKTIDNFPLAFLDKLKLTSGKNIYKIRGKKLKFITRAGTEDLPEVVVVESGYEYNLNLITLSKNPTIVDLGGHIGSFSIYMANKLKDKCKIVVFEPDVDNFDLIKQNIVLNKIHSVIPVNAAISNRIGKGYLKRENMNTDAYHLENAKGKLPNCNLTTISASLRSKKIKSVDLLKIDIEGGEYDIFLHKESLNFILRNVHYIFIEYHETNPKMKYSAIKNIIEDNFKVLERHANVLTLENLNWNQIK